MEILKLYFVESVKLDCPQSGFQLACTAPTWVSRLLTLFLLPQGYILGPLMFLIYVNDLATVSVNSSIALFADDTKCYRPVMNNREL